MRTAGASESDGYLGLSLTAGRCYLILAHLQSPHAIIVPIGGAKVVLSVLKLLASMLCRASSPEDWRFGSIPCNLLHQAGNRVTMHSCPRGQIWPFFRTGDLGRLGPNGLEIHGRIDNQVKVGGVPQLSAFTLTHFYCLAIGPGLST